MKVLFLYIDAFSRVGGIQQFNKNFLTAISESAEAGRDIINSYALHDAVKDFKGLEKVKKGTAGGSRLKFLLASYWLAAGSDVIIVGHINLLFPLVLLLKYFLKKRIILIAHGIEMWKPLPFYKKACLAKLDLIIAVSSFTKSKIMEIHSVPENKIAVLPNTIDPSFPLKELGLKPEAILKRHAIPAESKVLLTICRISEGEQYKGYDKVITCLKDLIADFPNIHYIIAGKYDEREKKRIENIVSENALNERVHFTGYVSNDELSDYYRACDIFIMPSKKEGFGIVFLEALVNGKPVIAGNKDGSVDALLQGELGILVDPDKEEEIGNAIKNVLNKRVDPRFFDQEFLRAKCLEHFSFEHFISRVQRLIDGQ
jgi:phosphatidyl-myo-inositol dimannoside synthase